MNKLMILTAAALVMGAPVAMAEEKDKGQKEVPGIFTVQDTNKDDFVSRQEYMEFSIKRAESVFAAIDSDGDGRISKEESINARGSIARKLKDKQKNPNAEKSDESVEKPSEAVEQKTDTAPAE